MVKQLTGAEDEEEDCLKDLDENEEDCKEETSNADADLNPKKQITLLSTRIKLMLFCIMNQKNLMKML